MMFTNEAYSRPEIARELEKSENYVYEKMKAANIPPDGEKVTAMGPNTKVWRGTTMSRLIEDGLFSNTKVGDIVWFDPSSKSVEENLKEISDRRAVSKEVASKPTQVYLIKGYLMDDNQRKPIYKIGITNKKDVIKTRFKEEITTGLLEDVNLLANFWCETRLEAEKLEESLFKLVVDTFGGYKMTDGSNEVRFHNFWTKDMPKGITEMRKLNVKETTFLVEYFNNLTSE